MRRPKSGPSRCALLRRNMMLARSTSRATKLGSPGKGPTVRGSIRLPDGSVYIDPHHSDDEEPASVSGWPSGWRLSPGRSAILRRRPPFPGPLSIYWPWPGLSLTACCWQEAGESDSLLSLYGKPCSSEKAAALCPAGTEGARYKPQSLTSPPTPRPPVRLQTARQPKAQSRTHRSTLRSPHSPSSPPR